MDLMLIFGLVAVFASFYIGVPELKNDVGLYLQIESFILVIGGAVASAIISMTGRQGKSMVVIFRQMFFRPKQLQPIDAVKKTSQNFRISPKPVQSSPSRGRKRVW